MLFKGGKAAALNKQSGKAATAVEEARSAMKAREGAPEKVIAAAQAIGVALSESIGGGRAGKEAYQDFMKRAEEAIFKGGIGEVLSQGLKRAEGNADALGKKYDRVQDALVVPGKFIEDMKALTEMGVKAVGNLKAPADAMEQAIQKIRDARIALHVVIDETDMQRAPEVLPAPLAEPGPPGGGMAPDWEFEPPAPPPVRKPATLQEQADAWKRGQAPALTEAQAAALELGHRMLARDNAILRLGETLDRLVAAHGSEAAIEAILARIRELDAKQIASDAKFAALQNQAGLAM